VTVVPDIDLTTTAGPVRDQGKRPTCLAFATSDVHASARSTTYEALSVEYLFYHACKRASQFDPHKAVNLNQILDTLAHDGQPAEEDWAYLPELPTDLTRYAAPKALSSVFKRVGTILPATFKSAEDELRAGRTPMFIFRCTQAFHFANADIPLTWSAADKSTTAHAVVVVGSGTRAPDRCLRVKNSWGSKWADAGYAWITETYFTATAIAVVHMV
jgi:hypothetical protein